MAGAPGRRSGCRPVSGLGLWGISWTIAPTASSPSKNLDLLRIAIPILGFLSVWLPTRAAMVSVP
eukprot:1458788-Amphidinium_carterae.1